MKKTVPIVVSAFIACIFLFSGLDAYSQQSSLTYKIKGKSTYGVDIVLSDENGNPDLKPEDFFAYTNVYFLLSPTTDSPKEFIREDDANEIISQIIIDQNGRQYNQTSQPRFLMNSQNRIDRILIGFAKTDAKLYNEFAFNVSGYFSEKIKLNESYFESFEPNQKTYESGKSNLEEAKYLLAYADFMKVLENAASKEAITTFSFYTPILNEALPKTISGFISAQTEEFNNVVKNFNENKNLETLASIEEMAKDASLKVETFDSYFSIETIDASSSKDQVLSFLNTLNEQSTQSQKVFEEEKMLFFKTKDYQDYKFELFIDLISKMLIYKNSLSFVENLEAIDNNLIKQFPESKRELMGDWGDELNTYLSLINKNIEESGKVFNESIMEHLSDLNATQKQPYYEIFAAFNALNNDKDEFKQLLQDALLISSDETILDYIEYWLISFRLTEDGINSAYMTQLNEGVELIQREQYSRADDVFGLLMRIANQYAPVWYYSGQIKHSLGESFSAERFFTKALEIYPNYLSPQKFILDIFESEKSFSQLLENANEAIEKMDAWYFRYKKASALYYLEKYDDAIAEINEQCITKNAWDINQYFLLGDAYLAIKDFEKAKAAFEKTLDIDPFSTDSKRFDDRMKIVYQEIEKAKNAENSEEKPENTEAKKTEEG